jgi:tripartite-type tricarboxylate transporter receptor subunit TctC
MINQYLIFTAFLIMLVAPKAIASSCDGVLTGKKITIQVPFPAGGSFDLMARALLEPMNELEAVRATVENKPALDGWLALKAVAKSQERDIQIGLFTAKTLIQLSNQKSLIWSETWLPLYTFTRQDSVWLTRASNSNDIHRKSFVTFAGSMNDRLEAQVVAKLLNKEIKIITGYNGTGEQAGATLRQEVDYFGPTLATANRLLRSGDFKPALVLGKALPGIYQNTPFLLGNGNAVKYRAKSSGSLSELELAQKLNRLSQATRIIISSRHIGEHLNQCVESLIDRSFRSETFQKKTEKLGFTIIHEGRIQSQQHVATIQQDILDLKKFVASD